MFKKLATGLIKWLIITVIVGAIVWTTSSIYKLIKREA